MGKSSGGTRNAVSANSKKWGGAIELNERTAVREFTNIERSYGRTTSYSGHDTKRLEKLRRIGKSYKQEEKFKAIKQYGEMVAYKPQMKEAAMSELVRVANRAAIHRDLPRIEAELKRRKGK